MVRVVPITVEGGRVIENRGEETNNIKIKYEESYTEDFRNQGHSKTQHEKNEKKVPNRPDMNNEKGRIIPIKLSEEYSRDSYQAVVLQTNPRSLRSVQNTDESQHKNVREKSDKSLTPILRPAANANVKTQQPIPAVITSGQAGSDEKQKLWQNNWKTAGHKDRRKGGMELGKSNEEESRKRASSLQEVNKIWQDLQQLDSLPTKDKSVTDIIVEPRLLERPPLSPVSLTKHYLPKSRKQSTPPTPMQTSTPITARKSSKPNSLKTSNQERPILPSLNLEPQYMSRSIPHFGFLPKRETKPGFISPTYTPGTRSSQAALRTRTIGYNNQGTSETECSPKSNTMPRTRTIWPENYDNMQHMLQKHSTNIDPKATSDTNFLSETPQSRCQSPPDHESPSNHSIYLKSESDNVNNEDDEESESPYEWMDFKDTNGQPRRGSIVNSPLRGSKDIKKCDKKGKSWKDEPRRGERGRTPASKKGRSVRTYSLSLGSDASTQTEGDPKKIGCQVM